jgi:hypothetical protein
MSSTPDGPCRATRPTATSSTGTSSPDPASSARGTSSTRTWTRADPEFEREGDFTDKDVTRTTPTPHPRSFTDKDVD